MKKIQVNIESPYQQTYGEIRFEKGNNDYLADKLFTYVRGANRAIQSIAVTPRIACKGYVITIELEQDCKENADK